MKTSPSPRLLLGASLILALAAGSSMAEPKQEPGKGGKPAAQQGHGQHGQSMHPGQSGGHKGQGGQADGQKGKGSQQPQDGRPNKGAHSEQDHHGSYGDDRYDDRDHDDHLSVHVGVRAPQIDVIDVRRILIDHRDLLAPAADLPPGIRMNVARGKPLPPGIAKKVDPRLIGRLPHYDGYEWQQVGRDILLVAIATGVVYEILEHVLD